MTTENLINPSYLLREKVVRYFAKKRAQHQQIREQLQKCSRLSTCRTPLPDLHRHRSKCYALCLKELDKSRKIQQLLHYFHYLDKKSSYSKHFRSSKKFGEVETFRNHGLSLTKPCLKLKKCMDHSVTYREFACPLISYTIIKAELSHGRDVFHGK